MNYEIITDRFEIEKMAEDMFLSDDEILIHIDYADLRTLKRHATFKHAIICDIERGNEAWTNEFINVIQSQQLPLDTLHAFLMNIIVGDEGMSLSHEDLYELLQFLTTVKFTDNDTEESRTKNYTDCLWSLSNHSSFPESTMRIQLMPTYDKTEQDKQEDEKYEQMIEEYRKPYFPPLDLPIIELYPNDKE